MQLVNNHLKTIEHMIHTTRLADKYTNTEKLPEEIHRQKQGVRFENPASNNIVPEGYMTIEQFRTEAKADLTKLLNKHGIY